MKQLRIFSPLFLLIVKICFSDDLVTETPTTKERNNHAGAIITVSLISGCVVGGGYLFYRFFFKERKRADSIISIVEKAWDSASVLYSIRNYNDAILQLEKITNYWYDYEKYSKRFKRKRHVDPVVIQNVIASSNFLREMTKIVDVLTEQVEQLPMDEFELADIERKEIIDKKMLIENSIDSLLSQHPNHKYAILYSCGHIRKRLDLVDSLLKQMYEQRRKEFALKSRFYYNQAIESRDSSAIQHFIDDCNYYQIEKEWCVRARLLADKNKIKTKKVLTPLKKMSTRDSIRYAFTEAIESERIELIEDYIKKYSSRRYSAYKKIAMLDSAKKTLSNLLNELEEKLRLSDQYPLFANLENLEKIKIIIKGLSDYGENSFNLAYEQILPDLCNIPFIRAPASVTIDYTTTPPCIMLDAFIIPELDIEKNYINNKKEYKIVSLLPSMSLLKKLRDKTIDLLNEVIEKKAKKEPLKDLLEYEIKKIKTANFVVRLSEVNKKGYITFYAKSNDREGDRTIKKDKINFYNFYDISTASYSTPRRIPIYPGSLPSLIPELSSDPVEHWMCKELFE